jgi:hypothetical protein
MKGLFVRIRFVVLEGDATVGKMLVILHDWARLCMCQSSKKHQRTWNRDVVFHVDQACIS